MGNNSKIRGFEFNRISGNKNNKKAFNELTENINIPDTPKIMKKIGSNDLRKFMKN
jgi:hypothetical protein